ncbi:hypothetical protein ACFP4H_04500 [Pseudophaeobacter arcticus]|uniref:hypothetical protein n=1 Tax=Pseudophaeobacter arcticus TaxID=385492 RepID=UPI000687ACD5|nr:hypothetical protein [Pseudophaeobacter arcticus]
MRRFFSGLTGGAVIALSGASGAGAQSLQSCDWVASAANLVEPWAETSRTYGDGAVRIALLDTGGEPACCSSHLLILSPDPEYGQACHVLSDRQGTGFRQVFLEQSNSRYDAGKGLLVTIPVGRFDPDTGGVDPASIQPVSIRINQSSGQLALEAASAAPASAPSASTLSASTPSASAPSVGDQGAKK